MESEYNQSYWNRRSADHQRNEKFLQKLQVQTWKGLTRARNTCKPKTNKLRGEAQLYNNLTCQLRSRITKKRLKPWSETWLTLSEMPHQLSNTSRKQNTEHKSHTRKIEMSITSFQAGPIRCLPMEKNWTKIRKGHQGLVPALCKFFLMEHVGENFFLEKKYELFELRKIFGWVVKAAFHGSIGSFWENYFGKIL